MREVVRAGTAEVPCVQRAGKADELEAGIRELYTRCKGNLVRVHEEFQGGGATLSYQALTAFCRRRGIGHQPAIPAGRYHFEPGEEMQHDTSPHVAEIAGVKVKVQTASAVLGYSRMLFFQLSLRFTRFDCKVFLTDAVRYFGGSPRRCVIDNTHVVVLRGTGAEMVPVPEMAAFAERLGFEFMAHEKGDANRSARVERPFHYIENNFLAGRSFTDLAHANREAIGTMLFRSPSSRRPATYARIASRRSRRPMSTNISSRNRVSFASSLASARLFIGDCRSQLAQLSK